MGSIVKGVASLFGGKKRRREQRAANADLDVKQKKADAFRFKNVYEGLQGPEFGGYDAAQGQAAQLGPAAQAEMAQLENEIQSRQFESEEFYDNSLVGLANEADARMQELEARRISEDWSDERYQNELSEYDQWYLDRTYEIQSDYDGRIREIEFDQRQYENLQTVVETNEIYQEGERGFFGNPIPGSVRQGGFTDDLSDPGNLAMLGIVITVGTTLLQLARGR